VRVPFHTLPSQVLAAGAAQQVMAPQAGISDRLAVIADAFDEYRLVSLRYRVRIDGTTATNTVSMAFFPGVTTTPPSSILQVGDNPMLSLRLTDDDVIPPFKVVPRGLLAGEQPWYKCNKATVTADDSVPGQLIFFGTGTDTLIYEMDGVFEFRGEADTNNTPLNPALLQKRIDTLNKRVSIWYEVVEKQRDQMRKLLTYQRSDTPLLTGLQWPAPMKKPA